MNCESFADWLDEGRPAQDSHAARSHLESCSVCSQYKELADRGEQMLSRVPAEPSSDFVARLMARVHATPQRAVQPLLPPAGDLLPWWVQAAVQPVSVLAFVLLGVLFWQAENLMAFAQSMLLWAESPASKVSAFLPSSLLSSEQPLVMAGVLLGISPLIALLALSFFWGAQSIMTSLSRSLSPREPQRVH